MIGKGEGAEPCAPEWTDERFMARALELARSAAARGEVPVGAVVVVDGQEVATGVNGRESERDPTAHAELVAIREAARRLGRWRLTGATLYVTLEPCPMCAGALVNARVDRLVFGCRDPKAGACGSLFHVVQDPRLNHRLEVTEGVLAEESAGLLRQFFRDLRAR